MESESIQRFNMILWMGIFDKKTHVLCVIFVGTSARRTCFCKEQGSSNLVYIL